MNCFFQKIMWTYYYFRSSLSIKDLTIEFFIKNSLIILTVVIFEFSRTIRARKHFIYTSVEFMTAIFLKKFLGSYAIIRAGAISRLSKDYLWSGQKNEYWAKICTTYSWLSNKSKWRGVRYRKWPNKL